jgi:hypothetical protein
MVDCPGGAACIVVGVVHAPERREGQDGASTSAGGQPMSSGVDYAIGVLVTISLGSELSQGEFPLIELWRLPAS